MAVGRLTIAQMGRDLEVHLGAREVVIIGPDAESRILGSSGSVAASISTLLAGAREEAVDAMMPHGLVSTTSELTREHGVPEKLLKRRCIRSKQTERF